MKGEVYRLRAPNRLREGLEEQDLDKLQFVSTAISAVSYLLLPLSLSFSPPSSQCALVQSQLSDVIKVTGDGRGMLASPLLMLYFTVLRPLYRQCHRPSTDHSPKTSPH